MPKSRFQACHSILLGLGLSISALAAPPEGYLHPNGLGAAVSQLGEANDRCSVSVIGTSREGRGLLLMTLAADSATAAGKPALLITAGLDGRHLVGTETALRVAQRLLDDHGALLDEITVYILPRMNPDGTSLNFGSLNAGHIGTLTEVDTDRDGAADEDGPNDLNGDGVITRMRRLSPPLDDAPTHMADPAEERLDKKPDALKGERAEFTLYTEGLDDDDDGLIAEDGPGMVDLDKNFMHGWREFDIDSGAYQLSEPEAHALATFVLEHPNIVAAITYGRHDSLVNPPDGKGNDITGRAPKTIDSGDVGIYKEISKVYMEITEQANAPKADSSGAFHAWLAGQRGVPSFATVVWGRPGEAKKPAPQEAGGGGIAGAWTGTIEIPEMGELDYTLELDGAATVTGSFTTEMFSIPLTGTFDESSGSISLTGEMGGQTAVSISGTVDGDTLNGTATGPDGDGTGITATRQSDGGSGSGDGEAGKPSDEEAAAWLKYSDKERDGSGFVEWTPFDHPTLGSVEIGGFVPGFKMNPPADELDDLATKQAEFAVALIEKRPKLTTAGPEVTKLADGLYEIRFALVNDGFLPTMTSQARTARSAAPTVVRLSLPVEQIVTGDRLGRAWGVAGSGGRDAHRWIIRVDDGATVTIEIVNPQLGSRDITFVAE